MLREREQKWTNCILQTKIWTSMSYLHSAFCVNGYIILHYLNDNEAVAKFYISVYHNDHS